ncbi:hypothetical protein DFP94_102185 [Fontibacillus phaseoli]|uniref:DinB family protein n=1 Tax=Fontibacillus phaseoli TaxID=1416533 RepID=A0A369BIL2_9BACL|nr:hypothetical protein [Fontibacillus phaseoli]RCX21432.1 hypothetical protein DFP94_102185 [Fontibacillus phaseoli]
MEAASFEKVFLKISLHRMNDMYFLKLKESLQGLSQELLWTENYPGSNTIGGITMHMCEHIARNCLRLSESDPELKQGFQEYFPSDTVTSQQLIQAFEEQLRAWSILMKRYIQGELPLNEEHIHQLYHLLEHAGYHLGQVIDRVQGATGEKLEFYKKGLHEAYLRSKIDSDLT